MSDVERTPSGIPGLDELIEGGFPKNRTFLVSGGTGTGKTIFGLQFIYNGALKYNEPGVYVTLDERADLIRQDVTRFNWDFVSLEQKNLLRIIDGSVARIGMPSEEKCALPATGFNLDNVLLEITRVVKAIGAKRVVIDSIPALGFNFESQHDVRKAVLRLSFMLMRMGVTSIIISEVEEGSAQFGRYGVEEFVADGVIMLHYDENGIFGFEGKGVNRALHIRKMRATKHSELKHPIEITSKGKDTGIVVHQLKKQFE